MEKQEFCEALKNGEVALVNAGDGYSKEYRGSYYRFKIYAKGQEVNHFNSPWIKELPYYVSRSRVMAMTVWGMSQSFEAQYKIATQCCMAELGKYDHDYVYSNYPKVKIMGV